MDRERFNLNKLYQTKLYLLVHGYVNEVDRNEIPMDIIQVIATWHSGSQTISALPGNMSSSAECICGKYGFFKHTWNILNINKDVLSSAMIQYYRPHYAGLVDIVNMRTVPYKPVSLLSSTKFITIEIVINFNLYKIPKEKDQIIFKDNQLRIQHFKTFKRDKSLIYIFIYNTSTNPQRNIQIEINKNVLMLDFDNSNCVPNPKLINAKQAMISFIKYKASVAIEFGLKNATELPVFPYNVSLSIHSRTITIPINITDLLTPEIISTKTFGVNWHQQRFRQGSFAVNVTTTSASTHTYIDKITKLLHLHHVETRQNEIIASGSLSSVIDKEIVMPVLVYCRCTFRQSYSVIIRATFANISKAISIELPDVLR